MIDFLKKLICINHEYDVVQILKATYKVDETKTMDCPITLLVCKKCGKRKVLKEEDWLYTKTVLNALKLWKQYKLDINDIYEG